MKNRLNGISLSCLFLVIGFWIVACGPPPQNTNQGANAVNQSNVNAANTANLTTTSVFDSSRCKDSEPIADRRKDIEDELTEDFDKYPRLKQYVKFAVRVQGDYIVIWLGGGVHFKDDIDDLIKIVRKHLKSKCALRVHFVKDIPGESQTAAPPPPGDGGFEWFGCEYPKIACSDGRCEEAQNCKKDRDPAATPDSPPSNTNGGNK